MTPCLPSSANLLPDTADDETYAIRALEVLLWKEATFEAFQKGFEGGAEQVRDPVLQARILLNIARGLRLGRPATWGRVGARLRLCHKAGWGCTSSFLKEGKHDEQNKYDDIWEIWEEEVLHAGNKSILLQPTSSELEALGEAFSLFLTLLPPPLGLMHHITGALHLLHLPLLQALRLGLNEQRPRFSEEAFQEHLLKGLETGCLHHKDAAPDFFGTALFQEARTWTNTLSPSFFENLLRQITTLPPEGVSALQCAQQLHTHARLAESIPLSDRQTSSRKRL